MFIPAFAYTAAITYLSLVNLADTSVGQWGVSDKVMHAGAYFVMAGLWLLFYLLNYNAKAKSKKIIIICGFVAGFGIFIEVLQRGLTTYRELDVFDIIANTTGIFAAGVLVWFYLESIMRLKPKISSFFLKK